MNSVLEQFEEGEHAAPSAGDYFIVYGEHFCWYVSTAMARLVEDALTAVPPEEWVVFVDLTGSRVRLRTRGIEYVVQCTAEQRAEERRHFRLLKRERKADRSWEEDE